jgi:hypothetical protein
MQSLKAPSKRIFALLCGAQPRERLLLDGVPTARRPLSAVRLGAPYPGAFKVLQ